MLRKYYILRELVEGGLVRMNYVATENNVADPLTKALDRQKLVTHRLAMGLRKVVDWI